MESTPLLIEMRARIRRHMLTTIAGVFVGIAIAAVGGVLLTTTFAAAPPSWRVALPIAGFLAIPAIGWGSARRNLRCPACNKRVGWQVNEHYSAFAGPARNDCRHCGQQIFAAHTQVRSRRLLVVLIGVAAALVMLGVAGAVLGPR